MTAHICPICGKLLSFDVVNTSKGDKLVARCCNKFYEMDDDELSFADRTDKYVM